MSTVTMKQMLEAGVHFGHQTKRWNPKMKPYIFGARNGIYIIDLQQTVLMWRRAYDFISDLVGRGEKVLFVGTKKQAQEVVAEEASRAGMFYVNNRWLGGTLTNFKTVKQSIERLRTVERMSTDGTFEKLPKKEVLKLGHERSIHLVARILRVDRDTPLRGQILVERTFVLCTSLAVHGD